MCQKILRSESDERRVGRNSCCHEVVEWRTVEGLRRVDCRLSVRDDAILESVLVKSDQRPLFLRLLQAKLADAERDIVGRTFEPRPVCNKCRVAIPRAASRCPWCFAPLVTPQERHIHGRMHQSTSRHSRGNRLRTDKVGQFS